MDAQKLQEAGVNYTLALKQFAGNEKLLEKYLGKFVDDDHTEKARAALDRNDINDILDQTHALKGIVGTLSITNVFEAACTIVDNIRANKTDNLEAEMQRLEAEVAKTKAALAE